jgi:hypothetical protein
MIAELLSTLPEWALIALDATMILGALGGLGWWGERIIDARWPANPRPPAHLMRTANAKQIDSEVGQLWGRDATRVERVRAGDKLRPSYPKQPAPADTTARAGGYQPAERQYPHLVKAPPPKP